MPMKRLTKQLQLMTRSPKQLNLQRLLKPQELLIIPLRNTKEILQLSRLKPLLMLSAQRYLLMKKTLKTSANSLNLLKNASLLPLLVLTALLTHLLSSTRRSLTRLLLHPHLRLQVLMFLLTKSSTRQQPLMIKNPKLPKVLPHSALTV